MKIKSLLFALGFISCVSVGLVHIKYQKELKEYFEPRYEVVFKSPSKAGLVTVTKESKRFDHSYYYASIDGRGRLLGEFPTEEGVLFIDPDFGGSNHYQLDGKYRK